MPEASLTQVKERCEICLYGDGVIVSNQGDKPHVKRRGFIAAGLLAAGAGLGALARRSEVRPAPRNTPTPESRFAYDVSEFEKTDPSKLLYSPDGDFATGFNGVKRIATGPAGIWVAGDQGLRLFSPDGKLESELKLPIKPYCLHPLENGDVLVGTKDLLLVTDARGRETWRTSRFPGRSYFTAMAVHHQMIYVADAGNREVIVIDRRSGDVIDRFGQVDTARGNPGFAIPSPYFDLRIGPNGKLHVANPGRTRIETYSLDGRFESAWGEPGMQINRFCGCCNPVFFTVTAQGDFITSEKGLARLNVYSPAGQFKGAVAGPETLVEDKELARRACVDCQVGAGFDVAVNSQNRVFALDPYRKSVRSFTPVHT